LNISASNFTALFFSVAVLHYFSTKCDSLVLSNRQKHLAPAIQKSQLGFYGCLTHSQCDAGNITFCDFCCFRCASF